MFFFKNFLCTLFYEKVENFEGFTNNAAICAIFQRPLTDRSSKVVIMDGRRLSTVEHCGARGDQPRLIGSGDAYGDGRHKIHRIGICRTANCIVSHIISPSCIWLKLSNHITEQLQLIDLGTLVPLTQVSEGMYVMAPLRKGLYARARIVQLAFAENNKPRRETMIYARVLFIDEGTTSWVSVACLAKMDEMLSFHPWQAIAVCLFKVRPKNGRNWSEKECETLRTILAKYTMVQIAVVLNSVRSNDYHDLIKVNMIGINSDRDSLGDSIAHLLARHCKEVIYDRRIFDAVTQKIYPVVRIANCDSNSKIDQLIQVEEWKSRFPEEDNKKPSELEQQSAGWDQCDIGPQIEIVDIDWLNAEGYLNRRKCLVNAEGRYTISPYEFYVRPLLMKKSEDRIGESGESIGSVDIYVEQMDAMIAANDEFLKLADDLNSFYGHPKNRKPIDSQRVKETLEQGMSAYGIAEVDSEIARFMGCWQRVEIIGLKAIEKTEEYYCRVRFLDSGGTDIRLLSGIIDIYPIHCRRPPLCLQVCLHGIKPAQGDEWSSAARDYFYRELREDVPISLKVIGTLNRREKNSKLSYDSTACRRANVMFVSDVRVLDGSSESLDVRLVRQGYAVWSANSPVLDGSSESLDVRLVRQGYAVWSANSPVSQPLG
uniref:Tudor domain-containing protein n=1 Tax=Ascaris lumbricoides TaxID=6252 RepID=A0A9J2PT63_ASCLU